MIRRIPSAGLIPFDNSTNGFVSDNVQDAIEESAIPGGGGNFSFKVIEVGETVMVPENQVLFWRRSLIIRGELRLLGDLEEIA